MTKQPESLRLADALEQKEYPPRRTAAAELRRLHAENERLREALLAEREACAKVTEDIDIVEFEHCMVVHQDAAKTLTNAAAAIRARGEQEQPR
jgi:hypothetical protein